LRPMSSHRTRTARRIRSCDGGQSMHRRALVALLLLMLGTVSAHAEGHIYLSCSHGHAVTKTTLEDGRVRTKTGAGASPFSVDVDLEHKTINGFYDVPHGQQFENGSVTIGGDATKLSTEHDPGYQDTISIDRLSGTTIVTHRYLPSDDCAGRRVPSCRMLETTTIYHCGPAATDFPTPIPRMMRSWERLNSAFSLARVRRALRRLYIGLVQPD
jgi:hypothetical protein